MVFARALDAHHILGLFDHADHRTVTSRVGAYRAGAGFAHVAANITEADLGLDLLDGLGQIARFIFGRGQHVEGDTLRALRPDAGQPPESVDQSLYCAVISKCHGYSSLFVLIIHPSASWQAGCSWGSSDHLPRIARLF